ncbi:MAG TPA: YibE/F family protein [Kineosporiaceae bacterium]|nr:YibE/F family protein [Kineosporiaceae bacterium]
MGGSHSHAPSAARDSDHEIGASAGVRTALFAAVALITFGVLFGLGLLWPRGPLPPSARQAVTYAGGTIQSAQVTSVTTASCPGTSDNRLPDGTIPTTVTCVTVQARLSDGDRTGAVVSVPVSPQIYQAGIRSGDRINVVRYPQAAGQPDAYSWVDFSRDLPLGVLGVIFAVLVVAVARLRGVAALVGLGLGYLTVLKFMLPALQRGENGAAVAFVGSVAIMIVLLYVAHGVSAKTTTALLGTVAGLAVTAGLAVWASGAVHLNGLTSEDNYTLSMLTGTSLSGIILCGIVVAGLGVLNDVTVTQASAVWELHASAPHLGAGRLFAAGMRIGRDHLASTVYTIAFAYAGVAMPTLLLIDLYRQPLHLVLSSGDIAEEIARTLVGAIGLVLAIPLTTGIAAIVVSRNATDRAIRHLRRPAPEGDAPAVAHATDAPRAFPAYRLDPSYPQDQSRPQGTSLL